jgi:hypothetical protein
MVLLLQVWIVSAGAWTNWPKFTSDYSDLADAFLHGQLSLRERPPLALLALPDPYDPKANHPYAHHDMVLFGGRYYLIWGPVPAVVIAIASALTGNFGPKVGDQYLTFAFAAGTEALVLWLLLQIKNRLYPRQATGNLMIPFLSLSVGAPLLFAISRGAVYEASILGGQFFLIAGLCAAWQGFASELPRPKWLLLAGIFWALAAGSRISLFPAAAALALLGLLRLRRLKPGWTCRMSLVAPIACAVVLIGIYNFKRFDSFTNFGFRFQLAGVNQHSGPSSDLFSARFLVPNVFGYLFAPLYAENAFPYLWASVRNDSYLTGRHSWLAAHLHMPHYYNFEPLVGVVWAQPFLFFGWRALRHNATGVRRDSIERWFVWSVFTAAALGLAPALMIFTSTMRYLLDALPCLTILAALGYWRILNSLETHPAAALRVRWLVGILITIQGVIGILLSFTSNGGNFYLHNPDLFFRIRSLLPTF